MVYDFSHYNTIAGRVVRFTIGANEYAHALEAQPAIAASVLVEHETPVGVEIAVRIAAARRLVDTLEGIGGDAAVAARMLRGHLERMVAELRASRPVVLPPRAFANRGRPVRRAGAA